MLWICFNAFFWRCRQLKRNLKQREFQAQTHASERFMWDMMDTYGYMPFHTEFLVKKRQNRFFSNNSIALTRLFNGIPGFQPRKKPSAEWPYWWMRLVNRDTSANRPVTLEPAHKTHSAAAPFLWHHHGSFGEFGYRRWWRYVNVIFSGSNNKTYSLGKTCEGSWKKKQVAKNEE